MARYKDRTLFGHPPVTKPVTKRASKTQEQRLYERLQRGAVDPIIAWQDLGIYRLSARVYDLRQRGHDIQKSKKKIPNRFGEMIVVHEYYLVE